MSELPIADGIVETDNARRQADLRRDYEALGERLDRRGIAIDALADKVADFGVAIPTWGVGTGGTRFARFPWPGEPRSAEPTGACRYRAVLTAWPRWRADRPQMSSIPA